MGKMGSSLIVAVSVVEAYAFTLVATSSNPYVHFLGGTQFHAGILGSIGALIHLFWNPISGSFSDTIGRKTVLIKCLVVALIGNLLAAFASSLTIFFIARILATWGAQITTILKSLVDDTIKKKEAKIATINRMQAVGSSCFVFGVVTTGFLTEYKNGFRYIFYLVSAMYAANIVLVTLFLKNPKQSKKGVPIPNKWGEVTKVFTNLKRIDWLQFWDLFTLKFTVNLVLIVFQFNLGFTLVNRFAIVGRSVGFVYALVSVVAIVTSLTMPRVRKSFYAGDKSGMRRILHGSILLIGAFLGLGLSSTFPLFFIHVLSVPVGKILLESTFTEVVLAKAKTEKKGSVMEALDSAMALAGVTAPLVSGYITDTWGNNTVFLVSIIPLLVGATVTYLKRQPVTKTTKKTD